jgi:hypothetical protein
LTNEKETCDKSCFFLRDVDATDDSKNDKGLLALILHWRDDLDDESVISDWVMKFSKDINKSNLDIHNKLNKLIAIINS